ncbi:MAG: hypothetical protein Q8O76_09555, partial [Chloroflexota bacterium]|nr:hypothetical protein [Chloroflexota bacterium]
MSLLMFAHRSPPIVTSTPPHGGRRPSFLIAASLLAILLLLVGALNPTPIPTSATASTPTTSPTTTLTSQGLGEQAYSYVLRLSSEPRDPDSGGEGRAGWFLINWFMNAGYPVKMETF